MTDYLVIYESGEAGWGAYSPDLPGVAVVGTTRAEVETLTREAIPFRLAGLRERGLTVPEPHNVAASSPPERPPRLLAPAR